MPRILLGMNGGIDSSVAAWMLKRDAREVVGVTLHFHDLPAEQAGAAEAARICELLGIEHREVDLRERYRHEVERPVISACEAGDVPDADVLCAKELMFPALREIADELGCERIATGHYARIIRSDTGVGLRHVRLCMPADRYKDQSYQLYGISCKAMERLEFPLADVTKHEVRQTAMRRGLAQFAELADSRGWAFPEQGGYFEWLELQGLLNPNPGRIIRLGSTRAIGTHRGLCHYNLGERIATDDPTAGYVVAKDPFANVIYAGAENLALGELCRLKELAWVSSEPFNEVRSCRVRLSQAAKPVPCQVRPESDGHALVSFTMPRAGLTPGHPAVFYSDEIALGGGVII